MRFFVIISAAIHIAAFFLIASVPKIKPSKMSYQPLYSSLTHVQNWRINKHKERSYTYAKNTPIHPKAEKENMPRVKEIIKENKAVDNNEANTSHSELLIKNYYSPTDVEIVALPTSNLDSSMFSDLFISGLPIKFRLYINAFGRVTKVDHIDLLEQDLLMANRLEFLLKQITFLPAKRGGSNVDSYQDIEFSF